MDVKSLYTSIPHEDGLIDLRHFLDQRPDPEPPTNTLICLAELVLQKISFLLMVLSTFKKVVLQWVVILDVLLPAFLYVIREKKSSKNYQGPIPELFKRFVYDSIGASSMPLSDLQKFISFVCNFHPALQFEYQISSSCLSFLDIKLQITDNHITTSIFYKDTGSHSYFHNDSSHNPKCITSIPFSELLRLRRLCNGDEDFKTKANEMSTFFSN